MINGESHKTGYEEDIMGASRELDKYFTGDNDVVKCEPQKRKSIDEILNDLDEIKALLAQKGNGGGGSGNWFTRAAGSNEFMTKLVAFVGGLILILFVGFRHLSGEMADIVKENSPYKEDKPIIQKHMKDAEAALKEIPVMNSRLSAIDAKLDFILSDRFLSTGDLRKLEQYKKRQGIEEVEVEDNGQKKVHELKTDELE